MRLFVVRCVVCCWCAMCWCWCWCVTLTLHPSTHHVYPVCTFKTSPCVPALRPQVLPRAGVVPVHTGTFCMYNTGVFSVPHRTTRTHHDHNDTQHKPTTTHADTDRATERDRERQREIERDRERRQRESERKRDKTREDETRQEGKRR